MTQRDKEHMNAVLKHCNLDALTYSPGDGATRYKFAPKGMYGDYFVADRGAQACGFKEAMTWLYGYQQAIIDQHMKERQHNEYKVSSGISTDV